MSVTVSLTHDYPYPAHMVWDVATSFDHLKTVTNGLIAFRNLPAGRLYNGQHILVDVSLFGRLPYQPYEMNVLALDDHARTFQSSEVGAGVKSWCHDLRVVETGTGSRIEETIEIDAGLLSPLFGTWARFMYRKRHAPRLAILAALSAETTAPPR